MWTAKCIIKVEAEGRVAPFFQAPHQINGVRDPALAEWAVGCIPLLAQQALLKLNSRCEKDVFQWEIDKDWAPLVRGLLVKSFRHIRKGWQHARKGHLIFLIDHNWHQIDGVLRHHRHPKDALTPHSFPTLCHPTVKPTYMEDGYNFRDTTRQHGLSARQVASMTHFKYHLT